MNTELKPANAERLAKMVDAGQMLFLRNGLRGTTMAAIAKEAGVAKPTLYNYFPDKEAVFGAVAERFAAQLRAEAVAGFAAAGSPAERVARVLGAKFKSVHRLLEGSPHAEELYSEKRRGAGACFVALERWLEDEIVRVLTEADHESPRNYAQLMIACADGIARKAQHAEQIGPAIRLVAGKLL